MKTDFTDRIAKIIADVHDRTCIDKADIEVLEDILQGELNEYYEAVYDDGYSAGYYEGHSDGYSEGYSAGYTEGYSDF